MAPSETVSPSPGSAEPEGSGSPAQDHGALEKHPLYRLFFPRSVALVGVSGQMGYGAASFLNALEAFGYPACGRIYPINPKYDGQDLHGYRCYGSLSGLPESPDFVLYGLPASQAPSLVAEAVAVGAGFMILFTSGFNETHSETGSALVREISEIIDSADNRDPAGNRRLRIVGPNCLGVYNPDAGLGYFSGQSRAANGRVSIVSQSGGQAELLIEFFAQRNIPVRFCVSAGNSLDLSIADYLDFYRVDPATEAIACYMEGLGPGQGRRLLSVARRISADKPVVVWKTGKMPAAVHAISSHTGALAGDMKVFEGAMRQAGAVMAHSLESVFDSTRTLLHSAARKPDSPAIQGSSQRVGVKNSGLRVAIVGSGGGFSVDVIDTFCAKGLHRAVFSEHTKQRLAEVLPAINTILVNPVDMGEYGYAPAVFREAVDVIFADGNVDLVVVTRETDRFASFSQWFQLDDIGGEFAGAIRDAVLKYGKPVLVITTAISRGAAAEKEHARFLDHLDDAGIPSFPTVERAATAALALKNDRKRRPA